MLSARRSYGQLLLRQLDGRYLYAVDAAVVPQFHVTWLVVASMVGVM